MPHSHVMTSSNLKIFTKSLFGQLANGTVIKIKFCRLINLQLWKKILAKTSFSVIYK